MMVDNGKIKFQTFCAVFLNIVALLCAVWFFANFREAGLVWIKEYLFFIAHWMSEILIVILSLLLAFAMFRKPQKPRMGVFFVLGMILSASFNAFFYYSYRDLHTSLAGIAGFVFVTGLVLTVMALRSACFTEEKFLIKFGLVGIGVLINFHLDIIVPNIENHFWAGFVNSLFLLAAGVYFLILILNKRDTSD